MWKWFQVRSWWKRSCSSLYNLPDHLSRRLDKVYHYAHIWSRLTWIFPTSVAWYLYNLALYCYLIKLHVQHQSSLFWNFHHLSMFKFDYCQIFQLFHTQIRKCFTNVFKTFAFLLELLNNTYLPWFFKFYQQLRILSKVKQFCSQWTCLALLSDTQIK